MERQNCWQVKQCGRELGGKNAGEKGVCPASISSEYNGVNRGENAGRFCWAVENTHCTRKSQSSVADTLMCCINCDFFQQVNEDEGRGFILLPKNIN